MQAIRHHLKATSSSALAIAVCSRVYYYTSGVGMGKEIADRDMKLEICFHLLSLLILRYLLFLRNSDCRVSDSQTAGKQVLVVLQYCQIQLRIF